MYVWRAVANAAHVTRVNILKLKSIYFLLIFIFRENETITLTTSVMHDIQRTDQRSERDILCEQKYKFLSGKEEKEIKKLKRFNLNCWL